MSRSWVHTHCGLHAGNHFGLRDILAWAVMSISHALFMEMQRIRGDMQSLMQGETSTRQNYTPADWAAAQAYFNLGSAPGNTVGGTYVPYPGSNYATVQRGGGILQGGIRVGTPGAFVGPPSY